MANDGVRLLADLRDLRASIIQEAAARIERWQPEIEQPSFTASAVNLAHYLAFRHHDLRDLQRELMRHGLSSLGRLESRVLVTLEAVQAALAALIEGNAPPPGWPPSSDDFFRGELQLLHNTSDSARRIVRSESAAYLSPCHWRRRRTPATCWRSRAAAPTWCGSTARMTARMHWASMIDNTRKAGNAVGRRIPVLMDIAGPKFRVGKVKRQAGERLMTGDRFRLVRSEAEFGADAVIDAVCEPGARAGSPDPGNRGVVRRRQADRRDGRMSAWVGGGAGATHGAKGLQDEAGTRPDCSRALNCIWTL